MKLLEVLSSNTNRAPRATQPQIERHEPRPATLVAQKSIERNRLTLARGQWREIARVDEPECAKIPGLFD